MMGLSSKALKLYQTDNLKYNDWRKRLLAS